MMKQALRSYVASLHPRNIKKLQENNSAIWVYILLILVYTIPAMLPGKSVQDWICSFFFLSIPMFSMTWSDLSSRYLMPKAMFLCSMREKERKEYILCVLKCKIGGPMVLGIFINLIWSIDYGFQVWRLLTMLFLYFSAGIAHYIAYEYPVKKGEKAPWVIYDKNGKAIYPWLSSGLGVAIVIEIASISALDYNPNIMQMEVVNIIFPVFIGVMFFVITLIDIIILKTQLQYITENIGDYEKNFKIQAKSQTPQKYDLFAK